jgi:GTPase SAR1 family protein
MDCNNLTAKEITAISLIASISNTVLHLQTSGVEIVIAPVHVPDTTAMVELFLFDTAGQDIYTEMAPTYWNGIQIAMLVYDVTNPESFKSCKKWLDLIKSNRCVVKAAAPCRSSCLIHPLPLSLMITLIITVVIVIRDVELCRRSIIVDHSTS